MKRLCLFLILWIGIALPLSSQEAGKEEINSIAIITPTQEDSPPVFSSSFIEKILRRFKHADTDSLLFEKVVNLNDLLVLDEIQISLTDIIDSRTLKEERRTPWKLKKRKSADLDTFLLYDRQLQFNITSFKDYINYEFILYDIEKDTSKGQDSDTLFLSIIAEGSKQFSVALFEQGASVEDFEFKIENALKDLFPKAHQVPEAIISVDQQRLNGTALNDSTISAAVGDTIFLDALFSRDWDTDRKRLLYNWARLYGRNEPIDRNLQEFTNGPYCKLIPKRAGTYCYELFVDDQVDRTQQQAKARTRIYVEVHDKIPFRLSPKTIYTNYPRSALPFIRKREDRTDTLRIIPLNSIPDNLPADSLHLYGQDQDGERFLDRQVPKGPSTIQLRPGSNPRKQVKIYLETPDGIRSFDTLQFRNVSYSPWSIGFRYNFAEITFADSLDILQTRTGKKLNEPLFYLYRKFGKHFELGLGWSLGQKNWLNSNSEEAYRLDFSSELEVNFNFYETHYTKLAINGLYKAVSIEKSNGTFLESLIGLSARFQFPFFVFKSKGYISFLTDFGISRVLSNHSFLARYDKHAGIGLLYHIQTN